MVHASMAKRRAVILCVDDEANPLVLRKMVLEKAGYEVLAAHSAQEALEVIAANRVDLVLSDHLMPGTTGAQLAQQVKERYPQIPVMLLSGVNEIPLEADSADVFLSKVEGPDKLCQQIAEVLNESSESGSGQV